jgi:hypothetical protein
MDDGRRFFEKPNFWPRLFGVLFLLIFLIIFRSELLLIWQLMVAFVVFVVKRQLNPVSPDTLRAVTVLMLNLVLYLVVYFLTLKWISLFVLPAHSRSERKQVFTRLVEYVFGLHGPAVFVKNGKLVSRKDGDDKHDKVKDWFASLAQVDLTSAVVIESRELPGITKVLKKPPAGGEKGTPIRAIGPGTGFLEPGERIIGGVDLRKQSRQKKDVRVITSDGIELKTIVDVTFTLGQPPEVITVIDTKGTSRDEVGAGLYALEIDPATHKILSIADTIDKADKIEIYESIQQKKPTRSPKMMVEQAHPVKIPYTFDEARCIDAIITQPRNTRDGKLEEWADLPVRVGVSMLLDDISKISCNQLYSLDRPEQESFLFDEFKPKFSRKYKNLGVLSYQFVQRKDGSIPKVGDTFKYEEYLTWDIRPLHNPKPLRDRGIKLLEILFWDFEPIDRAVLDQRFETWRSHWQKRTDQTNTAVELEIMRNMNHARAQAQREIVYNLSQIFRLPGYSEDAMAIRVFQALESAAANPATSKLLPRDMLDMLKTLQRLFIVQGKDEPRAESFSGPADDNPPEGTR